ncbi:DUF3679 domain-containing protein [Tumebacillus permanentifrigoris]|uniref:Uncharacterized protein DUF3679 n=1 Tax=Tumebacillus permanentifrigoris TaxID=378543 RepID=A0A316D7C1_9BACL|nr:DUF3679 domain-containing protein [Tumebacillus permanentifrigoris]PWK08384.1 uncharacterized protein DUF3679 [Tumebacillus permanentifrigoris]
MRIKSMLEHTAVYGVLLIMLALLVIFGISTAEKGVNSLVGTNDPQALVIKSGPRGDVDLKILGKDVKTGTSTKPSWSQELSQDLEGQQSTVADGLDSASVNMGTWMQTGAKKLLDSLSGVFTSN